MTDAVEEFIANVKNRFGDRIHVVAFGDNDMDFTGRIQWYDDEEPTDRAHFSLWATVDKPVDFEVDPKKVSYGVDQWEVTSRGRKWAFRNATKERAIYDA